MAIAPTIYVICSDDPAPSGAARRLYRHVDVLNELGYRAFIVHQTPGLRLNWFENQTPIASNPVNISPGDIVVAPELFGQDLADLGGGKATWKVIFNQNAYHTFHKYSLDLTKTRTPYLEANVLAAITVSEDSREYLQYAFPGTAVFRVRHWIDGAMHHPQSPKKKRVAYAPGNNGPDVQQVLRILAHRGVLAGWELLPIVNQSKSDAAAILRESRVFFSFEDPAGFGLMAAEAMACGCVIVGYHGFGGREFLRREFGFPIESADILAYALAAEQVLRELAGNENAYDGMTARASEFIGSTYSRENERNDIASAWSSIVAKTTAAKA